MVEKMNICRISVGEPEGKPPGCWEDNIKMDLRETGWNDIDWIDLAWERD
jgi:hypothetical protein